MAITNRIQLLASDMSKQFHDKEHFGLYLRIAKQFPEGFLRQKMSEIKERMETNKKIKNWGAYFTTVVFKTYNNK